ncbi:hypothetical protein ACLB2K_056960 [Fragaria x ananassa]
MHELVTAWSSTGEGVDEGCCDALWRSSLRHGYGGSVSRQRAQRWFPDGAEGGEAQITFRFGPWTGSSLRRLGPKFGLRFCVLAQVLS